MKYLVKYEIQEDKNGEIRKYDYDSYNDSLEDAWAKARYLINSCYLSYFYLKIEVTPQ